LVLCVPVFSEKPQGNLAYIAARQRFLFHEGEGIVTPQKYFGKTHFKDLRIAFTTNDPHLHRISFAVGEVYHIPKYGNTLLRMMVAKMELKKYNQTLWVDQDHDKESEQWVFLKRWQKNS